jgi:hypothetical protein
VKWKNLLRWLIVECYPFKYIENASICQCKDTNIPLSSIGKCYMIFFVCFGINIQVIDLTQATSMKKVIYISIYIETQSEVFSTTDERVKE